jgi:hypothetical protein
MAGRAPSGQALVASDGAQEVSTQTGFDPSRWAALREQGSWEFFGNAEPLCPHCAAHCSIDQNEWWHLYSDGEIHTVECPSCVREFEVRSSASWSFSTDDQEVMAEEDAIAMEARRGATTGATAEGGDSAGPKDIAQ